jgi:hypothetical protein
MRIQKVGVLSVARTFGVLLATVPVVAGVMFVATMGVVALVSQVTGSGGTLDVQELAATAVVVLLGGPIF